jgi:hypothetical protein
MFMKIPAPKRDRHIPRCPQINTALLENQKQVKPAINAPTSPETPIK